MALRWEEVLKGLPEELMVKFNRMNTTAKQYTANRILGFNKVDSMRNAGSNAKDGASLSSTAKSLEDRNPAIEEIVAYAQEHNFESQLLNEKSKFNQTIEQKQQEALITQATSAASVMSPNMAESVAFYRRVASGSVKTYKTTEKYDANGKLVERRKEIIDDAETRMRAREKLDRLLGINAMQNLGQVQVGSISINIVDASKDDKEEREVDVQDEAIVTDDGEEIIDSGTIIEQEPQVEIETPKPKKEKPKDTRKPLYYVNEKGERRRRPSWDR